MGGYYDENGNYWDDATGPAHQYIPVYPPSPDQYTQIYNVKTDYSAATYNLLLEIKKMLQILLEK